MAHSFLNPEVIARAALSALRNRTILSGLVWRNAESEFGGGTGDSITIRRPPTFTARLFDRSRGIEPQDITEHGIRLTLDDIYDVSVVLTDEEVLLDVRNLSEQVVTPALTAIADAMDKLVAETLDTLPEEITWNDTDPLTTLTEARMRLNRMGAPQANRAIVLSPEAARRLLNTDTVRRADASGDGGQALREASLGRLMGFDLYEYNGVTAPGGAYAFHREAVALASRSLANPPASSGASASSQAFEGYAVRSVQGYELRSKQQVMSFDSLVGLDLINHATDPEDGTLNLGLRVGPGSDNGNGDNGGDDGGNGGGGGDNGDGDGESGAQAASTRTRTTKKAS